MAVSTKRLVLLMVFSCVVLPHRSAVAADPPRVKVEFRRAETKPAEGLSEASVAGSGEKVYLHKAVEITNADIAKASPGLSADSRYEVIVRFTKEGAEKMAKLSEAHRGKPLAILVDGKVVCAPVLRDKITEYAAITGSFTQREAERIAKGIAGN
jgi:preprotein translocase subunit SecD